MEDSPVTNKSLGQHWLNDAAALNSIADAAELNQNDLVLEIGPGPGALTKVLINKVEQVVAVEFDSQLATRLPQNINSASLSVVNQDILKFDFGSLRPDYKIVANIPYYLTSNLIRVISETPNQPLMAILLIQKEVAERVAAAPGKTSPLSITAQYFWEVSLGEVVPAGLFTPPPKVDSQVLIMRRRSKPLFDDVIPKDFFRLVKAGFSQRRKTLLNTLSSGLNIDKPAIKIMCESVGIDPGRRAQTLSLEEWHNLYLSVNT